MKKLILVSLIVMLVLSIVLVACAGPLVGEAKRQSFFKQVPTPEQLRKPSTIIEKESPVIACKDYDYDATSLYTTFLTKGKVISNEYPDGIDDYCKDSNVLIEGICDENKYKGISFGCTSYSKDYECKDGACVPQKICFDPDFNDYNKYGLKTTVLVKGLGGTDAKPDSCKDTQYLIEAKCSSTKDIDTEIYDCNQLGTYYECKNGACMNCESYKIELDKNQKLYEKTKWYYGTLIDSLVLQAEEMPILLADNIYVTNKGSYKGSCSYQQFIFTRVSEILSDGTKISTSSFSVNNMVNKLTNAKEDLLYIKSNDAMVKYQLEFQLSAESPIKNNILTDFVGTKLIMLGEEYTIVKAEHPHQNMVKLVLKSANQILELQDNNVIDEKGDYVLKINNKPIEGVWGKITGVEENNIFYLRTIQVIISAADEYQIPLGGLLSKSIINSGKKKETLFTNNWDVKFSSYNQTTGKGVVEFLSSCRLKEGCKQVFNSDSCQGDIWVHTYTNSCTNTPYIIEEDCAVNPSYTCGKDNQGDIDCISK